ncbi:hypothetical protein FIBSPDRAFT_1054374 [Athelia psychrophila]|uniref:Uncharacterized protein n=1 Tax=Athelia psychrophila TaxID=1759441 RepID=A0A167VF01_9AGAM|nr:hypothetical protein FIBSPDRAFT_1054374 [Fibularhizoctonia sp. CBS 109695]
MGGNANKRKLSNASAEVPADAKVDSKKAKKADANDEASATATTKPEVVEEEEDSEGDEEDSGDKVAAVSAEDEPEETHYFLWGDAILSLMENMIDEHPVLRRKEHIMEAYARKKALGEDSEDDFEPGDIDIWDAEAAEDDEDGTPFTSTHAKRFVELYKAKDKEADERQAKKELKNTWWWVLTFTKREPVGDMPRIKIGFSHWERGSQERWLINMEVATDEEDEAMSEMLDHVLSYSD